MDPRVKPEDDRRENIDYALISSLRSFAMRVLFLVAAFLLCSPSTSHAYRQAGSGTEESFFEKNQPLSTCEIRGVDTDKKAEIRQWLSVMPAAVQRSMDLIEVHSHRDDGFTGARVGYCFKNTKTGRIEIHILAESLDPETVWHEAQHAYDLLRNEIGEIRWRGAAGRGYKNRDRAYPSDGVLTRYGSTSWAEDKAEWAKKIYEYLSGRGNVFTKIRDRSDPRYLKKLKILNDDGSISYEDYEKIKQLFDPI